MRLLAMDQGADRVRLRSMRGLARFERFARHPETRGFVHGHKPLDMAKFALKAYHRFTRDTEVGAPAVAHFLLNQPSFYMPQGGRSVTINFYWVKVAFQTTLTALLNTSG